MTVMTKIDLTEAVAVLSDILFVMQQSLAGKTGDLVAQANFLCGQIAINGGSTLFNNNAQFWIDLRACFDAVQQAGASFPAMQVVLSTANKFTPAGRPAISVKNFVIRMALMEQALILAAIEFTSRQQIDGYFDQIDAAFQAAELVAADNLDHAAYTALIEVHAAVSADLSTRAFTLPQMVSYLFPSAVPSLWLAQRLYGDASRNNELIVENNPIHPLFMRPTGRALAV